MGAPIAILTFYRCYSNILPALRPFHRLQGWTGCVSMKHDKSFVLAFIKIDSLHQEKSFCHHNMIFLKAKIVTKVQNEQIEEIKVWLVIVKSR